MSNDTKQNDWKERELGAFWQKTSVNDPDKKYFTGRLRVDGKEIDAVIFYHKAEGPDDKKPNLQVYKSVPRDDAPPVSKGKTDSPQVSQDDDTPF